eukprot:m.168117 g.168117  ORF g.168117 m.168117 type:complete len:231 (-) comp18199_c0_seq14:129-821(-)
MRVLMRILLSVLLAFTQTCVVAGSILNQVTLHWSRATVANAAQIVSPTDPDESCLNCATDHHPLLVCVPRNGASNYAHQVKPNPRVEQHAVWKVPHDLVWVPLPGSGIPVPALRIDAVVQSDGLTGAPSSTQVSTQVSATVHFVCGNDESAFDDVDVYHPAYPVLWQGTAEQFSVLPLPLWLHDGVLAGSTDGCVRGDMSRVDTMIVRVPQLCGGTAPMYLRCVCMLCVQ